MKEKIDIILKNDVNEDAFIKAVRKFGFKTVRNYDLNKSTFDNDNLKFTLIKKKDKFNIIIDNPDVNSLANSMGDCVNNIVNFLLENKAVNEEDLIKREIVLDKKKSSSMPSGANVQKMITKKDKKIEVKDIYDFPEDYPVNTDDIIESISGIENEEPNQVVKNIFPFQKEDNKINIKSYENAVKYFVKYIFEEYKKELD
ncbi:hypothetical protein R4K48_10980 [Brachyspira pulli]|uniref:hypothetical protein n=1 Tax=Brachyspira pulli TaxID=310721 RepID=UPI0030063C2F